MMPVGRNFLVGAAIRVLLAMVVAGCEAPASGATASEAMATAAETAPESATPLALDEAVAKAVDATFAAVPADASPRGTTIAPLVDGATGEQSVATTLIREKIAAHLKARFAGLAPAPFTAATLGDHPYVLTGTLTPADADAPETRGNGAFVLCLALTDVDRGTQVAGATALVDGAGVDPAPTAFQHESPVWIARSPDRSCQAEAADAADPNDARAAMVARATLDDAVQNYEAGRLREADALFRQASTLADGTSVDALNGLYMIAARQGRREDSVSAFAALVGRGLDADEFAIKLRFRPISTGFVENPSVTGAYAMWLAQIARLAASRNDCLLVTGHTGKSGSPALNASVSLARAHVIQAELEQAQPALRRRVLARGPAGEDASDTLDGRVSFKTLPACEGTVSPKA